MDSDPKAVEVYRANFPGCQHVYCEDLTKLEPVELAQRIGTDRVDVIVGGPPCQGYSHVRQVDGSNNGERLVEDPRRTLYRTFLEFVGFFRPAMFFMENVRGIVSAEGGIHFRGLLEQTDEIGYFPSHDVVNAANHGVPQSRRRLLFVGFRKDLAQASRTIEDLLGPGCDEPPTLWDAIGDLPCLEAGGGDDEMPYDMGRREQFLVDSDGGEYLNKVLQGVNGAPLTAHVARPHNDRDLRDFARLSPGENSKEALARGVEMEFPYNRDVFQDKYSRLAFDEPSRTILAHLSRDGLMFIHPEQTRSLTPREAARLQSFPDWFHFPVARTHQYRLIGNAVPPMLAERVGWGIKKVLDKSDGAR